MNSTISIKCSGLIRSTKETCDIETQTDLSFNLHEWAQNFKESARVTLANTCTGANISPNQLREAFQVISEQDFKFSYRFLTESTSAEPPLKKNTNKLFLKHVMEKHFDFVL